MNRKHFLLVAIATVLTSAFVWVRLQIVSISYDIHEQQNRERALREECNALSLRIHESRSPYRLEAVAKTLKMSAPRPEQIIVLRDTP